MDNIKVKYEAFLESPYPEELRGREIFGIELILLDSDSAGLIDKFIRNQGQLTQTDIKILKKCFTELKAIVKELNGNNKTYFGLLLNIVQQTVDYLKTD